MKANQYILAILILLKALFICEYAALAGDTLTMMQYNLLYYGTTTGFCTTTNNNLADKDGYMRTITGYVKPDILTVNEMGANSYAIDHLMDSVLNINGISHYKRGTYTNYSGSNIVNMIYYNSDKLILHSEYAISTNTRDINLYKLYYNSPDLGVSGDTAFITCIVAHLKAGSSSSDKTERQNMTTSLMNYLDNIGTSDNYIFSGDFNTQRSSENAFQNIINHSNTDIRFYDPINMLGNWNNNSSYSSIHTQSTHATSNGCASSGGMDDRFDFILVSDNILNGYDKIAYIDNSYFALGQDGNRFNGSLKSPSNYSAPSDVINSLYNMSDHLPVILELEIDQSAAVAFTNPETSVFDIDFINPATEKLSLKVKLSEMADINVQVLSLLGQVLVEKRIKGLSKSFEYSLPLQRLERGVYLVKISDNNNHQIIKKLLKL